MEVIIKKSKSLLGGRKFEVIEKDDEDNMEKLAAFKSLMEAKKFALENFGQDVPIKYILRNKAGSKIKL